MKLPASLLLAFGFAAVSSSAFAAPGTQTEQRMENGADGQKLAYWLYLPEGSDKAAKESIPLVLFLHGSGERGDDLNKVKAHGLAAKWVGKDSPLDGAIVVSPQCPNGSWWKVGVVKALLDEVLAAHPEADPARLYITGLSMGGYGTWGLLAEYPDLFAAAIPICGGGDATRLKKLKEDRRPVTFSLEKLRRAKDVPIWAFHGDEDGAVPVGESVFLVDDLKAAGSKSVQLTIYKGVNHDSWTQTYADPKVYEWLFAQRKS